MNQNLYFKTTKFDSSSALAEYVFSELKKYNLSPQEPVNSDYMFSIETKVEDTYVHIYMGKNDEVSDIPLWQIWPEQRVSFICKIFGKVDKSPELLVKDKLESIVKNIDGVSAIEWGI